MGVTREQRDQSQQNGGQNRDPALPVESNHRSQLSLQTAWTGQAGEDIRGTTAEPVDECRLLGLQPGETLKMSPGAWMGVAPGRQAPPCRCPRSNSQREKQSAHQLRTAIDPDSGEFRHQPTVKPAGSEQTTAFQPSRTMGDLTASKSLSRISWLRSPARDHATPC